MSLVQKLLMAVVPRSWAASMEAESRAWLARCETCGSARSIWELGGIRWKAAGRPRRWLNCPGCNPEGRDAAKLLERSIDEASVAFVPGGAFFFDGRGRNTLRLSFSLAGEGEIEHGIARLAKLI